MKRNVAGQFVGAQMITAADGTVFTGAVTVAVTLDAGTQATGSVGAGACAHEGNGYHTYAPAQAETNGDLAAFTFIGTGAIAATVQIYTSFPQTGDNFARLGAPAGASVSADVAAVKVDTAAVKVKTDFLPSATAGSSGGVFIAGSNAATSITTALTANVIGNVTGNLSGSVGSVTGAVGSVTADVGITQTGADKVWATVTRLLTAGTNIVLAKGVGVTGFNDLDAAGVRTAVGLASANMDTQLGAIDSVTDKLDTALQINSDSPGEYQFTESALELAPTGSGSGSGPSAATIADAVWDEARAGHVGAGSFGEGVASVQGNVTGTVASVAGAVGSVTGNVGGNVVGSVVGSVASVTAGVTVTTNNDKTGYRLSATGVDDMWDELIAGHLGVGSTGEALNNATAAGNPWASVVEAPYTGGDLLRIIAAVAAGKDSIVDLGGGAATVTFRDVTDASNIVVATMANSSRTAVALAP